MPAGSSTGRGWIRTSEGISQRIYSPLPLATWVHAQLSICNLRQSLPAAAPRQDSFPHDPHRTRPAGAPRPLLHRSPGVPRPAAGAMARAPHNHRATPQSATVLPTLASDPAIQAQNSDWAQNRQAVAPPSPGRKPSRNGRHRRRATAGARSPHAQDECCTTTRFAGSMPAGQKDAHAQPTSG